MHLIIRLRTSRASHTFDKEKRQQQAVEAVEAVNEDNDEDDGQLQHEVKQP
jgi:hypothetical protein